MCLFCRIVEKAVPARILYEDEFALAFEDINPQAPTHLLIVPKMHIASLNDLRENQRDTLGHLFWVAQKLAREKGIDRSGYRTVVNTGLEAGQSIFHLHVHLLGGRSLEWPPG